MLVRMRTKFLYVMIKDKMRLSFSKSSTYIMNRVQAKRYEGIQYKNSLKKQNFGQKEFIFFTVEIYTLN